MRSTIPLCSAALGVALAAAAPAAVIFDSDFTQAEGFVDGDIGFVGSNPDSIVGQATFSIADSAGAGFLASTGVSFTRALFGFQFGVVPDPFSVVVVSNLSAGDVIEVEATGLTFNPTGANVGPFGLSNINPGNILGGTSIAGGVQFTYDSSSDDLRLDTNIDFSASPGDDVSTGVGSGESFNYLQRFVATGSGTFDIEHLVNGALVLTDSGVTLNLGNGSADITGYLQDFGQAGATTVDGLRLELVFAVPEPSAAVVLCVCGVCAMTRRRKRATS